MYLRYFSRILRILLRTCLITTIFMITAVMNQSPTAALASSPTRAVFFTNDSSLESNISNISKKTSENNLTGPWELMSGTPWQKRAGHSSVILSDGSIILMGGYNGTDDLNDVWRSSDDGKSWTLMTASAEWLPRASFTSVALSDDSIVLMGGHGDSYFNDVWRSTDQGATWTRMTAAAGWSARYHHSSVVLSDDTILLMGGNVGTTTYADVWRSTDKGENWELLTDDAGWRLFSQSSVTLSNDHIVLMGGYYYYSPYPGGGNIRATSNDVFISEDNGLTWQKQADGPAATGGHTSVVLADDSILWMGGYFYTAIVGGNSYYTDRIWQSNDEGENWTLVTETPGWASRSGHTSVVLQDDTVVLMGGYNGNHFNDIWQSTDQAQNWSQIPYWTARYDHASIVLSDNSIVLMGGYGYNNDGSYYKNDVWCSIDQGKTWVNQVEHAPWSGRRNLSSVVLSNDDILIMGGFDGSQRLNDVWRSSDKGITWTQLIDDAEWSPRESHTSVVLSNGHILLMGGYTGTDRLNDVWLSTNQGTTWTQQIENADWSDRDEHTSVVLSDDNIVLMGGRESSSTFVNDTWISDDQGESWTQLTVSAEWTTRYAHSSLALSDDSIILMGGYVASSTYMNDVWMSEDQGETWSLITDNAEWSKRQRHTSVALSNDNIILMGGSNPYMNDVWRLGDNPLVMNFPVFLPLLLK